MSDKLKEELDQTIKMLNVYKKENKQIAEILNAYKDSNLPSLLNSIITRNEYLEHRYRDLYVSLANMVLKYRGQIQNDGDYGNVIDEATAALEWKIEDDNKWEKAFNLESEQDKQDRLETEQYHTDDIATLRAENERMRSALEDSLSTLFTIGRELAEFYDDFHILASPEIFKEVMAVIDKSSAALEQTK